MIKKFDNFVKESKDLISFDEGSNQYKLFLRMIEMGKPDEVIPINDGKGCPRIKYIYKPKNKIKVYVNGDRFGYEFILIGVSVTASTIGVSMEVLTKVDGKRNDFVDAEIEDLNIEDIISAFSTYKKII